MESTKCDQFGKNRNIYFKLISDPTIHVMYLSYLGLSASIRPDFSNGNIVSEFIKRLPLYYNNKI
jgi:hypothetical protein